MIRFFRNVLIPSRLPQGAPPSRSQSVIARMIALALCFLFTMDAINIDVLYAEAQEHYAYHDNPSIVDSQFDTTFQAIPYTSQGTSIQNIAKVKFNNHLKFKGAILYEDIDSPTVLDGTSTQTLITSFRSYFIGYSAPEHTVHTTFDRTISYLCLLI